LKLRNTSGSVGSAQEASYEIDVTNGHARGRVRAIYKDLEMAVLDKKTGTEKGFDNRVASFLENVLKIRNSNAPDASGSMKEGVVNYTRRRATSFSNLRGSPCGPVSWMSSASDGDVSATPQPAKFSLAANDDLARVTAPRG